MWDCFSAVDFLCNFVDEQTSDEQTSDEQKVHTNEIGYI